MSFFLMEYFTIVYFSGYQVVFKEYIDVAII